MTIYREMTLIIKMSEQINPWSVYDKHFEDAQNTNTLKKLESSPKKSIQKDNKTQHTKRIMKTECNQRMIDRSISVCQQKLRYIPIYLNKVQPSFHERGHFKQKQRLNCWLSRQQSEVNKLLEQRLILKLIRLQVFKVSRVLPRIETKHVKRVLTIGKTQRIHSKADFYEYQPQRLYSQQSRDYHKKEKIITLNLQPFDESELLKRALELMIKRKSIGKKHKISFSNRIPQ